MLASESNPYYPGNAAYNAAVDRFGSRTANAIYMASLIDDGGVTLRNALNDAAQVERGRELARPGSDSTAENLYDQLTTDPPAARWQALETDAMKHLTHLVIGMAIAMQASAQIVSPWQQQFAFTPSPDRTPSYVFYIGTNAGVPLVRVALTNASWESATNELTVGISKTNLFAGVTNYVFATARDTNGVESVPSNEINFVPPRPPVLRIEVLESSSINGPWRSVTNFALPTPVNRPEQYFAARLRL